MLQALANAYVMERFSDMGVVLKTIPYQDRDKIVYFLTENYGKVSGIAKGAIHSKRYGGSLDILVFSKFRWVQKQGSELVRIEEATMHHVFESFRSDYEKLTLASFGAEFCFKILESNLPVRDVFLTLSNFLFQLDQGLHLSIAMNAFLSKVFHSLGYSPNFFNCNQCQSSLSELLKSEQNLVWSSSSGGIMCRSCAKTKTSKEVSTASVLLLHKFLTTPFKEIKSGFNDFSDGDQKDLYILLSDFLHYHVPGVPAAGFDCWKLVNEALISNRT